MDTIIDRECATNLKNCVGSLYNMFAALKEEGDGVLLVGINPGFIPIANSAFTFLVSRSSDICKDEGILNAGCKVGLAIGQQGRRLRQLDNEVVEVRFDALIIFGVLLFTLLLVEIERGVMFIDEKRDEILVEKLKEFLAGIPQSLAESAKALPFNSIARVASLEGDSSAGHSVH